MINNQSSEFLDRIKIIKNLNSMFRSIFQDGYKSYSLWEWADNLGETLESFVLENSYRKVDSAFLNNVSGLIDYESLAKLFAGLVDFNAKLKVNVNHPISTLADGQVVDWANKLDLNTEGQERLKAYFSDLSSLELTSIKTEITRLIDLYQMCKTVLEPLAAVLLCCRPEDTPASIEEYNELFSRRSSDEILSTNFYPSLLRFLGQSIFGNNAEMQLEAFYILAVLDPNINILENTNEKLLFMSYVYLAFIGLNNLSLKQQKILFEGFAWWAFYFDFPLVHLLTEVLAEQPLLPFYLERSGSLAESLMNSTEKLYFDMTQEFPSVSDLVKGLEDFVKDKGGEDWHEDIRHQYVGNFISQKGLPAELQVKLEQLLSLFVHLRECDLIDYRGLLSDENIKPVMDWKKVFDHDLTETEINEIADYIKLLHRPTRTKVEIINALGEISWSEDPYLSRVLILNNIYEDIYPLFSPLVYFDEKLEKWEINIDLPQPWEIWKKPV